LYVLKHNTLHFKDRFYPRLQAYFFQNNFLYQEIIQPDEQSKGSHAPLCVKSSPPQMKCWMDTSYSIWSMLLTYMKYSNLNGC